MSEITKTDKFLRIKDLKERYNISSSAAYTLVRRKDFPALFLAGRFYIREDALIKWEEKQNMDKSRFYYGGV